MYKMNKQEEKNEITSSRCFMNRELLSNMQLLEFHNAVAGDEIELTLLQIVRDKIFIRGVNTRTNEFEMTENGHTLFRMATFIALN